MRVLAPKQFRSVISSGYHPIVMPAKVASVGADPDFTAWMAQVTGNLGTVNSGSQTIANTLIAGFKTDGTRTKIKQFWFGLGDFPAMPCCLWADLGSAILTNHNFVSGDWVETGSSGGLTGNAGNKYLDSGLSAAALTANSTSFGIYVHDSTTSFQTMGAEDGAGIPNTLEIHAPDTDSKMRSDQYDAFGGRATSPSTLSAPFALMLATRDSSSTHSMYQRGTLLTTSAGATGITLPAFNLFYFCTNQNGTPQSFSGQRLSCGLIGSGLSATDVSNIYTRIQAAQTSLTRNV